MRTAYKLSHIQLLSISLNRKKKKEIQLKKNYTYFNQHPSLLKKSVIPIKPLQTNTEEKKIKKKDDTSIHIGQICGPLSDTYNVKRKGNLTHLQMCPSGVYINMNITITL